MTYTPTPYAQAKDVPAAQLRRYLDIDVSLELPDPADEDGDLIEHEFTLFYKIAGAEPDVGIMSHYVDDWFYAMPDGTPVPEQVHYALDKIDAREGNGCMFGPNGKNALIDPTITDWHERNIESACDGDNLPY